jgi:hypothetical protein
MQVSDMTGPEKRALGTLVRVVVGVDGRYSTEEAEALDRAAEELGADDFWGAVRAAGRAHHAEEEIKAEARAVERQEARETIYGALFTIAASGSIVGSEGWVLDWLAETWGIEASEAPPSEEEG